MLHHADGAGASGGDSLALVRGAHENGRATPGGTHARPAGAVSLVSPSAMRLGGRAARSERVSGKPSGRSELAAGRCGLSGDGGAGGLGLLFAGPGGGGGAGGGRGG